MREAIKYYQVVETNAGGWDEGVHYEGYNIEKARKVLHNERSKNTDKKRKFELRESWLPKPADFMDEDELCDALSTYCVLEKEG